MGRRLGLHDMLGKYTHISCLQTYSFSVRFPLKSICTKLKRMSNVNAEFSIVFLISSIISHHYSRNAHVINGYFLHAHTRLIYIAYAKYSTDIIYVCTTHLNTYAYHIYYYADGENVAALFQIIAKVCVLFFSTSVESPANMQYARSSEMICMCSGNWILE